MEETNDVRGSLESPPSSGAPTSGARPSPDWRAWAAFGGFLIIYAWLYFFLGTHLIHQTNQDRLNWDQQHNIVMSLRSLEREKQPIGPGESVTAALWRSFPHYTDGVVNPLWPWIAARFATEDHEAYFVRGKWFNVILTGVFLLGLGLVAARAFSIPAAMAILLTGGLAAMLPRAPYFQPEPVYYLCFFLAWVCALSLMRRNSLWMYGVLGLLLGLSYLAKTSIQAFALAFIGVTTLRCLVEWWRGRKRVAGTPAIGDQWNVANHFIGLAVLAMTFLGTTGARLSYANEAFGSPFHSYPGYWMWMDDFQQGADFMQRYPNAEALAKLPAVEKPSAGNYLKRHSMAEVVERLRHGTMEKMGDFLAPKEWRKSGRELVPFRGWLLGAVGLALAVMAGMRWWAKRQKERWIWPVVSQSARWMLLFAAGTFVISALAFGFYEPIGKGDRFMLGLYLPVVVTFIWVAERFRRQLQRTDLARWANRAYFGILGLVILAVGARMIQLVADPVFMR
ncbi:MAG: hypothetical protein KDL87_06445 [Verrucomicrobiae bacterium]|nr:hypothetical protein [Verrucomicrobiae bacterium]